MYRWIDHTGELELEIEAADEAGIFVDGLAVLKELLGNANDDRGQVSHNIEITGRDRSALLAEFLAELLFLAETQEFVPNHMERLELRGDQLSATVQGQRGQPPHLVKAVTYHQLAFERSAEGWRAHLVLDV